jgi:hypothetical protein
MKEILELTWPVWLIVAILVILLVWDWWEDRKKPTGIITPDKKLSDEEIKKFKDLWNK